VKPKLSEALPASFWPHSIGLQPFTLADLRVLEVCIARLGSLDDVRTKKLAERLNSSYPAKDWPLNRELSQVLIYLDAPGVVKKTLDLRDAAATQEEQIHYMVALRNVK